MANQYLREMAPDGHVVVDMRPTNRAMNRSNWFRSFLTGARSVRREPKLTDARGSPARVVDFFEARHRLLTDSETIAQKGGMDRQVKEPAIRPQRADKFAGAFEQSCHWLIWVVVVAGLTVGIFGL